MADTLNNIQTDARFFADDGNLTINTGDGLRIFNLVYQGMASPDFKMLGITVGRQWPEWTREDTSITMVVGTEQYTWPTTPDFKQPTFIEGVINSTTEPYQIMWAPDMGTWRRYGNAGNAEPIYCRLIDVAGSVKIALRPTPNSTDTLRITGLIEVTELTAGTESTVFLHKNSDRALSMLVAAEYKAKRGDPQRALQLINDALSLLPANDNTPSLVGSGRVRPWGAGPRMSGGYW